MKINLSPQYRDDRLSLTKAGTTLIFNGLPFDLGALDDGEVPESEWIVGPVKRAGDDIEVTIILPHGSNAPEATLYPAPLIDVADGTVALPVYDIDPE